MMNTRIRSSGLLACLFLSAALLGFSTSQAEISGTSEWATWSCTGSPCPWGDSTGNPALIWPESAEPVNVRHGYTVSGGVYLPASSANGATIRIDSGSASIYAGTPSGPHFNLGSIAAGGVFEVSGLASDEVLSVQSDSTFTYTITLPASTEPENPPNDPENPTHPDGTASNFVTWTCTGSPCPWGDSTGNHALVWPEESQPLNARYGYTVSKGVYLPATIANGTIVWINSGSATLYAGPVSGSHAALATITVGEFYEVGGLAPGDVLSVQSDNSFTFAIALPEPPPPGDPVDPSGTLSTFVTWNCTSSPCPWGDTTSGQAVVWPEAAYPTNARHGYSVSADIYLPSNVANGAIVWINSGVATLYAGPPSGSHSALVTLGPGEFHEVGGLAPGDVLSVQSDSSFTYAIALPEPPPPGEPAEPSGDASRFTTWTCVDSPCPWGDSTSNHALVWPESAEPTSVRHGYRVSEGVYLPAVRANGAIVWINSGYANLYAGLPGGSHRLIASLADGAFHEVSGLAPGEVLSVQSDAPFTYAISLPPPPPPGSGGDDDAEIIESVTAYWRCDIQDCDSADWVGAVINWPSWAAYSSNARSGDRSRTVYSESGEVLYPYMGSWAHGCQVTARSGTVLIIEWERGTDVWRETWLEPGQSHIINLPSPENGAMIESYDWSPGFSVSLDNCTPQPLL